MKKKIIKIIFFKQNGNIDFRLIKNDSSCSGLKIAIKIKLKTILIRIAMKIATFLGPIKSLYPKLGRGPAPNRRGRGLGLFLPSLAIPIRGRK